ncbi:MAG: DUF1592 domain-containing protein, partial [Planctomycetota bacterium]
EGEWAEGGLDLTTLSTDSEHDWERWVRVHDRVASGEMPPPDYAEIPSAKRERFVSDLSRQIIKHQSSEFAEAGRVRGRRLTMVQIERSLHDLLKIDIPLASRYPDDARTHGYSTVADGQPMSLHHMRQQLDCVDLALEEAFTRAFRPKDATSKRFWNAKALSREKSSRANRYAELLNGHAVGYNSQLPYYPHFKATTAARDGWYRFTITAKAINKPEKNGIWCSVRSGKCTASAPTMNWIGAFEATAEPRKWTFVGWLREGDRLEIRSSDRALKNIRSPNGQIAAGLGGQQKVPGLAISSIVQEQINLSGDDAAVREAIAPGLRFKRHENWRLAGLSVRNDREARRAVMRIVPEFAERAFRRPLDDEAVAPYVKQAIKDLSDGMPLRGALFGAYRAILCSPRFLYFQEDAGPLDDYAVASRLSYFLWNSMPDDRLFAAAAEGRLSTDVGLRAEAERMLDDPRADGFVTDFADQWLDLCDIAATEPDRRFREFDMLVRQSMVAETVAFLGDMFDRDVGVGRLIDADYAFLDSRLARYYRVDADVSDRVTRVELDSRSERGGLLGQGAILKVTANGTETSPVVRGVWVAERILGKHIPAPPDNVAALEPDIRNAKTIRDLLEKHRADEACAACHRHMDPLGFALENFDPAGQWRTHYEGKSKHKIDASYVMNDGQPFSGFHEFRELVADEP